MNREPGSPSESRSAFVRVSRAAMGGLLLLSGIGIALLAIPTVIDVTFRRLVGGSIPGVVEVSEVALVCVIIFGMAAALRDGDHISTPLLTGRLSRRNAARVRALGMCFVVILLTIMVVGTVGSATDSYLSGEYRFGFVAVPVWPAKIAIPIGLGLLLVELVIQLTDAVRLASGGNAGDAAP